MASPVPPAFEIILINTPQEKQQAYDVRVNVFHHEQQFPLDTEFDEIDESDQTAHFLLRLTPSLIPIGTIRAFEVESASHYTSSNEDGKETGLTASTTITPLSANPTTTTTAGSGSAATIADTTTAATPVTTTTKAVKIRRFKLGRLAVLKQYRGYRFGAALVESVHRWVREQVAGTGDHRVEVVCHSQIPAKGFYAKFGYEPEGGEFDEDGDPHQKMILRIQLVQSDTTEYRAGEDRRD